MKRRVPPRSKTALTGVGGRPGDAGRGADS